MKKLLLGCDWGTSSFRMRLFDLEHEKVIGEVVSEDGIASMHKSWQDLSQPTGAMTKVNFFQEYLKKEIAGLTNSCSINVDGVTIVISGMASSSIGMQDVPYARLPFALDGSNTAVKLLSRIDNFLHDIILISGVRSENDVMRGEETQLMGLCALLKSANTIPEESILIFPGTHSKHIRIEDGMLVSFNTFMTGEIFSLMSKHSILRDSIQWDQADKPSKTDVDAFKLGVLKSREAGILNGLFTVRTNGLFDKLDKKQNASYLSGLLIGEEMNYLLKNEEIPIVLCSASNLAEFYKMAVEALNLSQRTTIIPADIVDNAALSGQVSVYKKLNLNT